ncbi:hypothetical protein BON22_4593 [Cyberlindnera fabianii]|uniref:Uncharacterized protein n=1 Tax=Cyberlindnera fabianii TaxID=36022 RepID=A0A1V2L383_CYBFA|nr:hypothetical protein BON22_4593 [Cyberlindnera fabianii]
MFSTLIARSAATLAGSASATPSHIRVTVNPSTVMSYLGLYAKKVPVIFQWGLVVGGLLSHPFWLKAVVNKAHLNNHTTPPHY